VWQTNRVTRKLFFNGYMQRFYIIFKEAFGFRNLYGHFAMTVEGYKVFPSGNFLFDAMWIDGLIGFVALLAFFVMFVIRLVKYFNKDKDERVLKVVLISVLLTAFFRFMLRYPFKIFTYQEFSDINNFPLINSPLFLVTVFIAGYVFVLKEDKKIEEEEVTHAEK
jgi:ABC-type enterochelin transport system permease subunit